MRGNRNDQPAARRRWRAGLSLLLFAAVAVVLASPVKKDEEVVFFPTVASFDAAAQRWDLPLHAWVFEPETDALARKPLLAALRQALGLHPNAEEQPVFARRAGSFLVDNEGGKRLSVQLDGQVFALPATGDHGHAYGTVSVPAAAVQRLAAPGGAPPAWLTLRAVLPPGDDRRFAASVRLAPPTGLSVISDLDDTIKVSQVKDHDALLAHTFVKPFQAVPGMAARYAAWEQDGAVFHYLSASPWQLAPFLSEFMAAEKFPLGELTLKHFRWKDSSFFDLFQSPAAYKVPVIAAVLARFPGRQFVLVGDAGEQDPEIYGTIARRHAAQIAGIYIRLLEGDDPAAPRFATAFTDVPPARWHLFRDAAELPAKLAAPE